jgi:uncharacterized membrane protein
VDTKQLAHIVSGIIEVAGICVLVIGGLVSVVRYFWFLKFPQKTLIPYLDFRKNLGRSILLGLEFLVAGDIISTITITPTLESVSVLGVIVIIRTFLSLSLEVEINGQWPWQSKADKPVSDESVIGTREIQR